MATKAEKWQVRAERAAQDKNKSQRKKKPQSKKAAVRAERSRKELRAALVERHDRAATRVPHNTAPRRAESAYELEATATGRPSRKSTRKSPSHLKRDTALRNRARERTVSPEARSGRRARRRRTAKQIVVKGEEE